MTQLSSSRWCQKLQLEFSSLLWEDLDLYTWVITKWLPLSFCMYNVRSVRSSDIRALDLELVRPLWHYCNLNKVVNNHWASKKVLIWKCFISACQSSSNLYISPSLSACWYNTVGFTLFKSYCCDRTQTIAAKPCRSKCPTGIIIRHPALFGIL